MNLIDTITIALVPHSFVIIWALPQVPFTDFELFITGILQIICIEPETGKYCVSYFNLKHINFTHYQSNLTIVLENQVLSILLQTILFNCSVIVFLFSGLLMNIFNLLHEESLISNDSFLAWKHDQSNLEQIGVSILSLSSFFSSLEEAETDDEVS